MKKDFNLIISGVGGQGLITLLMILARAALIEKKEVRTSELHGLAQRGGSVKVDIRFGQDIFSPLVSQQGADLVLVLEKNETLKNCYFGSKKKTIFLINDFKSDSPSFKGVKLPGDKEILKELKPFSKKASFIKASQLCKEKLGAGIVAGIFLVSLASFEKVLPLEPEAILEAIKKIVPKKFFKINERAFELARKYRIPK